MLTERIQWFYKKLGHIRSRFKLTGTQIIAIGFCLIILTGALLLKLPIASKSGESEPFVNTLFTATTATCVTGLVVADTYSNWTMFGQIVILLMIQTGGLGFMTMAALFALALNRRIGLKQRLLMSESINVSSISGIVRMTRNIILVTVCCEGLGALFLATRFIPEFGVAQGIYKSVFHAISAFCNAGIDLMGQKQPYSSLTSYMADPVVNLTICGLIIMGGLGFIVWEDIWHFVKGKRSLRFHTKLVLSITALLLGGGMVLILICEWTNPHTIQSLPLLQKIQAAFFQSVTARTAGFNTLDIAAMKNSSLFIMMLLMFIGGSPGSTAGGIKTTTFGILILAAISISRGSSHVHVFERRVESKAILRALSIVVISLGILFAGILLLSIFDDLSFTATIFEVISAFGTVGLTLGITPELSAPSRVVLILIMYLGRVGVMTAAMAIARRQKAFEDKLLYPKEELFL
jgi:trk system potassium uptake protein TrkH